jgi:hypothetical protein
MQEYDDDVETFILLTQRMQSAEARHLKDLCSAQMRCSVFCYNRDSIVEIVIVNLDEIRSRSIDARKTEF